MTRAPSASASSTNQRKCGCISGAPPVMSTTDALDSPHRLQHVPHRLARHGLGALRAALDMTVQAREVAREADVDLDRPDGRGAERAARGLDDGVMERQ